MKNITIYHSPDADDAFMFYGLTSGAITDAHFNFTHDLADIETLNHRALRGELEVTAVSVHAYAYLADKYLIMRSGASMGGEHYGPRIVAKKGSALHTGKKHRIAIPGTYTSAALATKLFLAEQKIEAELILVPFQEITHAVQSGEVTFGVLIHEGQLTFADDGLVCLVDLGEWWWNRTKLPLPLGINVVRRDLGTEAIAASGKVLKASIEYSLAHRDAAIKYALPFGRILSYEKADTFVGMYVNELTVDMGEVGERAIREFLGEAAAKGVIPALPEIAFA